MKVNEKIHNVSKTGTRFSFMSMTYVCADCVTDYAVTEFINREAEKFNCDYCGRRSDTVPIAAALSEVSDFMLQGIYREWSHPEDEAVAWDAEDQCYVVSTLDSYDLIDKYLPLDWGELRSDLVQQLGDRDWCQINPYRLTKEEAWIFDWERFSEQLKHETRYVFFRVQNHRDEFDEGVQNPHEIMDEIAEKVLEMDLITTISPGTIITRARPHDEPEQFSTVENLGPPPKEYATHANRMSPSGIAMFYGSDTETTALSEIEQTRFATVAEFVTLKEFKVLDLTRIPDTPSIFDLQLGGQRPQLIFLNAFLDDLTKKVVKDGREHIEYVPTQVITEYFRRVFRGHEQEQLKGIVYPSSRHESGVSYVLFFENSDCTQDDRDSDNERWLSMVTASVRTIDLHQRDIYLDSPLLKLISHRS
jgi:DNA-directed RNA polymerase subunit RPC12/RpoP